MKLVVITLIILSHYFCRGITMNIKSFIKNTKDAIVAFYTSGTVGAYVAIGATVVTGLAVITLSTVLLVSAITGDSDNDRKATINIYAAETTTEEETTTSPTTEAPSTTEEATTVEPTTEETTVEETTVEETTTKKPTPPPTIAVEDLDIGNKEEEATAETKPPIKQEFYEEETEPETQPPTTSKKEPATEEISTEKPTEPPVSEYACVVKGIDVSKWNSLDKKAIDWVKVKASGVQYVIIRAGYRGQTSAKMYADPYFEEHIEGALSAGLQVGVYFYSQAITEQEALEEASFLLSIIKDYKLTYPVCFDWEPVSGSRAGAAKLSKTQASAVARKFLSTMEGYGYEAMLYSYHSAIKTYFNTELLNDYKVWMAYYFKAYANNGVEYKAGDKLPSTSYPFQMWQYSSTGVVPGIQGVVDMNVSFFSYTGSGVPTSAIVLNPPAKSYTINVGGTVDYLTGVKAFNTAGIDTSSSVKASIKNAKGKEVKDDVAFNTAGKYTIVYSLKDFTGVTKTVEIPLVVRETPKFTLNSKTLTFNISNITYSEIIDEITKNIISVKDNEGNLLDISSVTIEGLDKLLNSNEDESTSGSDENNSTQECTTGEDASTEERTDSEETSISEETSTLDETSSSDHTASESTSEKSTLKTGSFTITYYIIDSKNLRGMQEITVILKDKEEETTTESSSEDNSSTETSSEETTLSIP